MLNFAETIRLLSISLNDEMIYEKNHTYIDINQSNENEQYVSPTTQDLCTALLGSNVWSITCL